LGYLKDSIYYKEAIRELEYSFGTFYLFENFVVSETNEGAHITWEEHTKQVVEELSELYEQKGEGIIFISNRVHSFSVKPSDWMKFFKSDYNLKAYAIVNHSRHSFVAYLMEMLFMRSTFKNFDCIDEAIVWAKRNQCERKNNE